ncbi:hypothetical protein LZ554_007509 [Drepanopeziza brunnea f. sp. 'monogermtubi']|nr:hypothetical protein LZ554_007509 [Drepanopeziza brunnea f. sp. 'monogermtubi']
MRGVSRYLHEGTIATILPMETSAPEVAASISRLPSRPTPTPPKDAISILRSHPSRSRNTIIRFHLRIIGIRTRLSDIPAPILDRLRPSGFDDLTDDLNGKSIAFRITRIVVDPSICGTAFFEIGIWFIPFPVNATMVSHAGIGVLQSGKGADNSHV